MSVIVVNAVIETTEDNIAALKQAIQVMEEKSRAESGCLDYTFSVELNNPSVLRITEKWVDAAALQAHFGESHMVDFRDAMAAHPARSLTATFYEATEIEMPR
jgi:quinol monooxygenase YgiN